MSAKAIEVRLDDGRALSLGAADWIGEGGEGAVYKKGPLAIKIVADKAALARKEPKLKIFMGIQHPALATPLRLAHGAGGELVGYAMSMVEGTPLARMMSPAWRAANGWSDDKLEDLCKSMAEALLALHAAGAWGGDINEFNWTVRSGRAVLIDCDSWGCPGHPVSAMLPSIADPKAGGSYQRESDWYALAVIIFAMYAGVHPFRGGMDGYGPKDMAARMAAGASLMSAGARWPAAAPGPLALPEGLRGWMRETLERGSRTAPPMGDWARVQAPRRAVKSGGGISLPAAFEAWAAPGLGRLAGGRFYDFAAGRELSAPSPDAGRWIDPSSGAPWWVWQDGAKIRGRMMDGQDSFEAQLPAGAALAIWGEERFSIKPGAWASWTIRRMGSMGVRAGASAQGILAGAQEAFDGCVACSSFGALALARPMGAGRGAMAVGMPKPSPGARMAMAACHGDFEFVEWAAADGSREVACSRRGKLLGAIPGSLDWACELGGSAALAQIEGQAWAATAEAVSRIDGWEGSASAPACWQGALWRVEAGSAQAKSYPLAKILAALKA